MLECRALAVAYGRHMALAGVDLRVAPGEIVVILGANGAGKSTLLKAVAGLVPAQAASQVLLDGKAITNQAPHRIVEAGLALVPEGRGIFGDLSVRENLLLGAYAQRARAQQGASFERLMNLFPKLAERSAQLARTMSGGEQQMVAIGRALMSAPAILMLDEPSLGLSPLLCSELFKTLAEVRKTGVGILLVEQNARQSLAIADRAYLLENGHVVGEGSAGQLLHDPAVQAAYLGGAVAASVALPPRAALALSAQPAAPIAPTAGARSASVDALISSSIADLVRNAAAVQAAHVEAQRAAPTGARRGAAEALGTPAKASDMLADALTRIAAAAAAARHPKHAPGPAPATLPDPGSLPTIEVWRRPAIEVWRRGADGRLEKQGD